MHQMACHDENCIVICSHCHRKLRKKYVANRQANLNNRNECVCVCNCLKNFLEKKNKSNFGSK